uniref:Cauli_VI domain-containing protein n=1 Tax=Angiostrongylus cantonensis TaxID=6313 RepID=A0A0K0DLB1_ANGCA
MGGPAVPTTNGGVLQHPYSYVQINIYDTNIKELQDRGVDIKHMLQHIGLRSVVMDVPILPSPPVNISVQTNARRAKSFGGFYLHARSAHSNSSTDNISVLNRTTEETGNIDVTSFEDNDSNCNETAVHDGNHTTLATSFIDSNISVVNRGVGEGCCGDPKSCRNGQDIYQVCFGNISKFGFYSWHGA